MGLKEAREEIKKVADSGERRLNLMRMNLVELPAEVFQLTDLSHLIIERNELVTIPPEIGILRNLEELYVNHNRLSTLPSEIGQLTHLRVLTLQINGLVELPPDIGKLSNLEELYISHNRLSTLPPEIGQLTHLRVLTLQNNHLVELPPDIGNLSDLGTLGLSDNRLVGLPPEFGKLVNLKKKLVLKNNEMATLPSMIGNLVYLELLDVGNNKLTKLPRQIGQLINLRSLLLPDNQLTALPSEIGDLENLQLLSLENNHLTRLPSEIGQLRHLTELRIQDNRLLTLPSEIGNLTRLKSFHLQNNNLFRLPSEIGQLINLESMYLQNNQLTALPPEVGDLANLQSLSLQNNKLTKLPQEVARLDKLQTLSLQEDQLFPLPLTSRIREWDVFISHSSEDKDTVALPLARALMSAGLKVWIDNQEIQLGDSIREKIDAGLSKSRFGVVILSQGFLDKVWTQRELNGLMAIEDEGEKVVLPVWHNISKATLTRYSPMLSDRAAANTQDGIPAVASQIIDVVLYRASDSPSTMFPSLARRFVQLIRDSSSTTNLRDFLIQHHRIISAAYRRMGECGSLTLSPRFLGQRIPSILARIGTEATVEEEMTVYIMLASPNTRLLGLESTSPKATDHEGSVLESARTLILNEKEAWDTGVIIAGRRHELNASDKTILEDFNRVNRVVHQESERPRIIEVRTYDWLIDACVSLEREFSRD